MNESLDFTKNFDRFEKYKGTEQLKLLKKLEDIADVFAMVDKSLVVKAEELSGDNLSLNVFKDNKWLISIDCRKDKIVIRKAPPTLSVGYRDYNENDEAVVESELRDSLRNK